MPRKREYDFDIIKTMSPSQMRQAARPLVDMANKRLKRLENAGINVGVISRIKNELGKIGLEKFSTKVENIENMVGTLIDFLSAETSTLKGARSLQSKTVKTLQDRFKLKIETPRAFFNILSSQQFKLLSQRIPSEQIVEDVDNMLTQGTTIDEIKSAYHEYLNSELDYTGLLRIFKNRKMLV